jgi:hypothetical protein
VCTADSAELDGQGCKHKAKYAARFLQVQGHVPCHPRVSSYRFADIWRDSGYEHIRLGSISGPRAILSLHCNILPFISGCPQFFSPRPQYFSTPPIIPILVDPKSVFPFCPNLPAVKKNKARRSHVSLRIYSRQMDTRMIIFLYPTVFSSLQMSRQ